MFLTAPRPVPLADLSPLVLCDYCPRSYHLLCLKLDWSDLPPGEWACPSCSAKNDELLSRGEGGERHKLQSIAAMERQRLERWGRAGQGRETYC